MKNLESDNICHVCGKRIPYGESYIEEYNFKSCKHDIVLCCNCGSIKNEEVLEMNNNVKNEILKDDVNRPSHYTDGKIEVIDFIEDKKLNFHRGNAIKYIARAGKKHKNKEIEDLQKAIWYLNREIDRLQKAE